MYITGTLCDVIYISVAVLYLTVVFFNVPVRALPSCVTPFLPLSSRHVSPVFFCSHFVCNFLLVISNPSLCIEKEERERERERENGVQEGEGERVGNQGYVGYTCQCLLLLHCNGEPVAIHWLHIHVLNCGLVC